MQHHANGGGLGVCTDKECRVGESRGFEGVAIQRMASHKDHCDRLGLGSVVHVGVTSGDKF